MDPEETPSSEASTQPPSDNAGYATPGQMAILLGSLPVSFGVQLALFRHFPRISVMASGAAIILLALACVRWWRLSPRRVLLLRGIRPAAGIHAVLLTVLLAILLAELQAITAPLLPLPQRLVEAMEGLLTARGGGELASVILAVSLFPALSEEMLFRGLIFTGLRARYGRSIAILGSGGLFAILHLNPWQLLPLLLIGVFIAYLVDRTDSLLTGILAHGTNNLLSLAALNLGRQYGIANLDAQTHLPPAVVLSASVLFLAAFVGFIRATRPAGIAW